MRLTFVCATPTTVPTIIVAPATTQTIAPHSERIGSNTARKTRRNAANAAAFTPVDMKPVTAGGAPSYASGGHMRKGTADTLNAKPTKSRPAATRAIGEAARDPASRRATWSRRVLAVRP